MVPISKSFVTILCVSIPVLASASIPAISPVPEHDIKTRVRDLLAKVKHSLRPLKGGTFDMGDWGTETGLHWDMEPDSRPLHKVTLDSFSMMAYKVTYEDFDIFTDAIGVERVDMEKFSVIHRAPRRPAGVSWHGAKAYCDWLAKQTDLPFALPTEAQWEYAARSGGKRVLYSTDSGKIDRGRNFPRERQHGEKKAPLPDVGSYPPNSAGLYGMSENTGEWVNDWYGADYYNHSPERNPPGPQAGTKKVQRGSVGGTAENAAMVFMRAARLPQPLDETYPNGFSYEKRVMVPFPGYSGYHVDNFRCVVNLKQKLN